MDLRKIVMTALLGAMLAPAAAAQASIPQPLSGNALQPRLSGEGQQTNMLNLTLGLSTQFDDNALNDNANKISNLVYQVTPGIAWKLSRSRWRFSADSSTPLSYSYGVPGYGVFGENLNVSFDFDATQRLNFRVRDGFSRSSDPFDQVGTAFGPLDQPNPSLLGPPSTRTSELVGADMTYRLAEHTSLGTSGTFSMITYEPLSGAASALQPDTYMVSGRAFVTQQISPRNTMSLSYDIQRFTFTGSVGATTHSISYYHTVALTPAMKLSLWAGPEYVSSGSPVPGLPASGAWSWTAGGSYDWTQPRTAITAGVVRQVSDGGGLGYLVELTTVNLGVRRQIGRKWIANVGAAYSLNDSLQAFGAFTSSYLSLNGSLTRNITPNLSLMLNYWRVHQTAPGVLGAAVAGDHNRAEVRINYSFSKSLGR